MITAIRFADDLPQSTSVNLFQVHGDVIVTGVYGTVATQIGSGSVNFQLLVGAAGAGGADMNGAAVGTILSAGRSSSGGVALAPPDSGYILATNSAYITATTDASRTGQMSWTVLYEQVTEGSSITAV